MESEVLKTSTEPMALYILIGILIVAITILGFLLRSMYKGLLERLKSLDETIKNFQTFMDKQEGKNTINEETKKRLDEVEDEVKELKKAHYVCIHYPLNQNRRIEK